MSLLQCVVYKKTDWFDCSYCQ